MLSLLSIDYLCACLKKKESNDESGIRTHARRLVLVVNPLGKTSALDPRPFRRLQQQSLAEFSRVQWNSILCVPFKRSHG